MQKLNKIAIESTGKYFIRKRKKKKRVSYCIIYTWS